jgi:amino acid permease
MMNYKKSIIGVIVAFLLATACCWLPGLIVILGGATGMLALNDSLEQYNEIFMSLGALLFFYGIYKIIRQKKSLRDPRQMALLKSVITCPKCGATKEETMPINTCVLFYKCDSCSANLKPTECYCCVYCSYGSEPCPPSQMEKRCC